MVAAEAGVSLVKIFDYSNTSCFNWKSTHNNRVNIVFLE